MMSRKTYRLFAALFIAVFVAVSFLGDARNIFANTTTTTATAWCENCGDNTIKLKGKVTVTVNPGSQTVKTRGSGATEQIGVNTAQYTVSASCQTEVLSSSCCQVFFASPSRNFTHEALFLPPHGVTPIPPNPGNPSVSLSGSEWSRTAKVHSQVAGEWRITFAVKVTYTLKDANGDDLLDQNGDPQTVTFPGTASCRFKATTGNFRIILVPDDNFTGRSLSALGVGETGSIYVEPIGSTLPSDILPLQDIWSSNASVLKKDTANLANGTMTFTAGSVKGSAVVIAKDKNGNEETYSIEIVEPAGVRFEEDATRRNTSNGVSLDVSPGTGTRGAAFVAKTYILPADVSFKGIKIGEEGAGGDLITEVRMVANGSFASFNNLNHPHGYATASGGNINTGSYLAEDNVYSGGSTQNGAGTAIWNIPWTYKTTAMTKPKQFATYEHRAENIGNKLTTMSKGGITVSRTIP